MFGKISAILNYMKIWDVYIIKRFPSNRISLWGMGFSYLVIFWAMKRFMLFRRENSLKNFRSIDKSKWSNSEIRKFRFFKSFNPTYIHKSII